MNDTTPSKPVGTGQARKLFYNKKYSDQYGVVWSLSTWKVLLWMLISIITLVILYSFFQDDQGDFLRDALFYSIIIMIIVTIAWVACNLVWKARNLFIQFLLAWILVLGLYWVLGMACQATGLFPNGFHYGLITWIVISALAAIAKNVGDGAIDRKDVLYLMLVFIIIFIANAPIFADDMGFLAQFDLFIAWAISKLAIINPELLYAG